MYKPLLNSEARTSSNVWKSVGLAFMLLGMFAGASYLNQSSQEIPVGSLEKPLHAYSQSELAELVDYANRVDELFEEIGSGYRSFPLDDGEEVAVGSAQQESHDFQPVTLQSVQFTKDSNPITSDESAVGTSLSDLAKPLPEKICVVAKNSDKGYTPNNNKDNYTSMGAKFPTKDFNPNSAEARAFVDGLFPTGIKPDSEEPADYKMWAKAGNDLLKSLLDKLLNALGPGCIYTQGPVKKWERVKQKAINDYTESGFVNLLKVMDIARFTVVCQDANFLFSVLNPMVKLLDKEPNAHLYRIKNKGLAPEFPEGFTLTKMGDITMNIKLKDTPFASEVQFMLLPILLKKGGLHKIYDDFRNLEEKRDGVARQAYPEECLAFLVQSQVIMNSAWEGCIKDPIGVANIPKIGQWTKTIMTKAADSDRNPPDTLLDYQSLYLTPDGDRTIVTKMSLAD